MYFAVAYRTFAWHGPGVCGVTWLQQLGVKEHLAWQLAMSSKGWWRLSRNPVIHQALPNPWFEKQGLFSLSSYNGYISINFLGYGYENYLLQGCPKCIRSPASAPAT